MTVTREESRMSQKYEREIDEIVRRRMDDRLPAENSDSRPQADIGKSVRGVVGGVMWRITPTRLLVLGVVLAFSGYFLRFASPLFAALAGLLSVIVLISALVISILGSKTVVRSERLWRGRELDYRIYEGPRLIHWLRRLFSPGKGKDQAPGN